MLIADAEWLPMTDAITPEAEERHTTVNINTDSANHEFNNVDRGEKDVRFFQEFFPGQDFGVREKENPMV